MEPREVCKICYNSTSHKPTPTLTYERNESGDEDSGEKSCPVCHQEWAPIRVAKELGSSRWVRIRPRPKLQNHIDFMMCKNLKTRNECPKGQDCSFAHSQAELWAWNQERQKEPRPAPHINGAYQYQLCKYISKSGNCPYGVKCTFAHNEEELQSWLKVQGVVGVAGSGSGQPRTNSGNYVSTYSAGTFKCNVCQLKFNSKKQLEDHINNSRHRQWGVGSSGGYNRQQTGTNSKPHVRPSSGQTRPRPTLSFHITGFRLCVHVQSGRRCLYGDYCTFAHSQAELDEWNQQVQRTEVNEWDQQVERSKTLVKEDSDHDHGEQGGVDTVQENSGSVKLNNGTKMDFSSSIRAEVAKEHKDTHVGLEASKEGVTIREITDTELAITTSSPSPISWVFEVTTSVQHILQAVLLFDPLNNDFDITYVFKHDSGSWEKVPIQAGTAEQSAGVLLSYKMVAYDKLQVKVTVKPRPGLLGQLVIFQFGSFRILQCMVVRMISENEEKLMIPKSHGKKRPVDVDLFWESHYSKIAMENSFLEDTDRHLPEYLLPQQIESLIEKGKYSNVENRVTKENYRRRMHNLLYLEEYQQRLDLSRYDLYDVEVKIESHYKTTMGVNYAEKGYHFVTLSIDELLFEGGQSIGKGDSALLLPSNKQVVHECFVEHVGRENVVLKITEKAKLASASSHLSVSVRFLLGRVPMRSMHYAVDQLDLTTIFPEVQITSNGGSIPSTADVQNCLDILKDSELNPSQLRAITSILDSSCLKIPSLVLGPFGCGKTRTLCECIELLAVHMPGACVLVCTHSNSAADIYVESLDKGWSSKNNQALSLFRLYFTGRRLNTITQTVLNYCKLSDGKLVVPSVEEMKNYKIVVTTLATARTLALMELPKGHFTHIFIDEAAQALESEALIPLSLADSQTKIVLAGDHMQLDPPVYSSIARKYGLHVSLLERLYDLEAYESGVGQLCKTLLTENHRSHHLILDLPSQLFYKNKLSCKARFPFPGPANLPAVKFVCVDGQEEQDEDSPSYYNSHEAIKIAEEAKLLVDGGLKDQDVCVLSYYSKQVHWIRNVLRRKKLSRVQVCSVEHAQGKEFRALIISTVRTSSTECSSGFLSNPKLFNTAVTRARQWLIVVGEPVTLCTVGSNRSCWLEYIRRCIGLNSFDHPHPSQFIESLDYKIVTRKLLEKNHQNFFKAAIVQKQFVAKTVSAATAEQSTAEPFKNFVPQSHQVRAGTRASSSDVTVGVANRPTVLEQAAGEEENTKTHLPFTHTFASKVQDSRPSVKTIGKESSVANRLGSCTTPPPKSLSNHSSLCHNTSPKYVHPEHAVGNHSSTDGAGFQHSDMLPSEALPSSLRNMVESVAAYAEWCEEMLAASYPLKISSKINDNLQRQKEILESQTKFVHEQIQLYRDYMKLRSSPSASGAGAGQSDTQQFHFPTALPPPISHPLSSGLNSAFTYDVGTSYFSSDSSAMRQSGSQTLMKDKQQLKGPSM